VIDDTGDHLWAFEESVHRSLEVRFIPIASKSRLIFVFQHAGISEFADSHDDDEALANFMDTRARQWLRDFPPNDDDDDEPKAMLTARAQQ
jgi:hypothetical protein